MLAQVESVGLPRRRAPAARPALFRARYREGVTLTERVPRLLEQLRAPRRVLPVTLPLLALVLVNVVVHTGGRHIDLEVYRFGVQAWLSGGDMYGTLPETADHITLPFIYPPFAALVLLPLAVVPWAAAWIGLLAL